MPNLLDLPEDVHLEICVHVGPQGLLALKQTCRVLHALGCTNYAWNKMVIGLPLDLPPKSDRQPLPALQLQRAVIKALRLEHNWRTRSTRIRHLKSILCGNTIDQMQLIGPGWLVTLSRSPSLTQIAVWNVGGSRCHRVASMDTSTALRFFADLQTQSEILVAVIEHNDPGNECLNIYSLCLTRGMNGPGTGGLDLRHSISKPLSKGTFFDVHVCRHLIAAAVARFPGPTSPPEYEVILVNTSTRMQWVIDPQFPPGVERVRLKLSFDGIVLAGVENNRVLLIREFSLPLLFTSRGTYEGSSGTAVDPYRTRLPPGIDSTDLTFWNHDAIRFPTGFDIHLPTEPANGSSDIIPIMVFPSPIVSTGSLAYMINFPLSSTASWREKPRSTTHVPMQPFSTPEKTSADIICVGRSGHRAVWMQRRWDNDEFEIVKTTFSDSGEQATVIPLFPKHTPLPFEPYACQSFAFNEASGRLCISVHTGGLFILDL